MASLLIPKTESLQPTLLPTPSPSPPSLSHPLPSDASTSARRTYTQAERQAHIALAKRCAEQLRQLHLANGAEVDAQSNTTGEKIERYHVQVERLEGEKKVMRRVAVIIPSGQKEVFRQHRLPGLTLVPPPHLTTPPKKTSLFPHSQSSSSPSSRPNNHRRTSLPSLRSLSLLPPQNPTPAYRSRASARSIAALPSSLSSNSQTPNSSPSKHHTSPEPLSRPCLPSTINLNTSSALLQRRRTALSLKFLKGSPSDRQASLPPTPPRSTSSSSSILKRKRTLTSEVESVHSKCARWTSTVEAGDEELDDMAMSIGESVKRERELSLGERRGRKIRSLVLL
ncbi:hypothetical protein JCM5353_000262 [Sporobolomyces roseus]